MKIKDFRHDKADTMYSEFMGSICSSINAIDPSLVHIPVTKALFSKHRLEPFIITIDGMSF